MMTSWYVICGLDPQIKNFGFANDFPPPTILTALFCRMLIFFNNNLEVALHANKPCGM